MSLPLAGSGHITTTESPVDPTALDVRPPDPPRLLVRYDRPKRFVIRGEKRATTYSPAVGKPDPCGRNARCPCGSGKKYKKCHRQQGTP